MTQNLIINHDFNNSDKDERLSLSWSTEGHETRDMRRRCSRNPSTTVLMSLSVFSSRVECKYTWTLSQAPPPSVDFWQYKWDSNPTRAEHTHTHLTWPSVHSVSTSSGPSTVNPCLMWMCIQSSRPRPGLVPAGGSRRRRLAERTVCSSQIFATTKRADEDEREQFLKCAACPWLRGRVNKICAF